MLFSSGLYKNIDNKGLSSVCPALRERVPVELIDIGVKVPFLKAIK